MKRYLIAAVAAVAVMVCLEGTAHGTPITPSDPAAYINTVGSVGNFGPNQYSGGWLFDLNNNYQVGSLGYFDANDDGFAENHTVGIYSCDNVGCTAGTLLISAVVTTGDPIYNHFRWVDVPGLNLVAGRYVVAGSAGTEGYQWTGGSVTFDPRVSWVEGRYTGSATLAFTDITNPNPPISYFGPNFASSVPEPGTMFLMGSVALLLAGRRIVRKG